MKIQNRLTLRPKEVANLVGVSPWVIRDLIYRGELKGKQVGKRWFIPAKEVWRVFLPSDSMKTTSEARAGDARIPSEA